MPIEFRCTTCQRLLRTDDGTAGKQAKCPECGMVLTIPPRSEPPAQPPPAAPSPSPFAGPAPYAGPLPPRDDNPYRSPTPYSAVPASPFGGPAPRVFAPTQVDFSTVFSRAWDVYTTQFGLCLGLGLLGLIVNVAVSFAAMFLGMGVAMALAPVVGELAIVGYWVVGFGTNLLLSSWIMVGICATFLKIARGEPAGPGDLFGGGRHLLSYIGGSILYSILLMIPIAIGGILAAVFAAAVMGGAMRARPDPLVLLPGVFIFGALTVVPTLVLFFTFYQYKFVVVDRDAGALDALGLSKEITRGNRMTMFFLFFVTAVLGAIVTLMTCYIGGLFVGPFWFTLEAVLYLAMTGQPTIGRAAPPLAGPPAGSPFAR